MRFVIRLQTGAMTERSGRAWTGTEAVSVIGLLLIVAMRRGVRAWSERRWCVHPDDARLLGSEGCDPVLDGRGERQRVAGLEPVELLRPREPDADGPGQHVHELLAGMLVVPVRRRTRREDEQL